LNRSWNDILDFIKRSLGTELNLLELSDDEIIQGLREDVLSRFSNHVPTKEYILIDHSNLVKSENAATPQYTYKLSVAEGKIILDIFEVYLPSSGFHNEVISEIIEGSYEGAIDAVITNTMMDAIKSIGVQNTWEFVPPDLIIFDQEIRAAVVVYNTVHEDLTTIRPDLYYEIFRPMCLQNVLYRLIKLRSKYDTLNTPFGPINLNIQDLKEEYASLTDKIETKLLSLPPDHLLIVI